MATNGTAVQVEMDGETFDLDHGRVVIAAITSCTNTSNPSVMLGAGLLAKKAREKGLERKPWVKTSLAPGSKVVTEYLDRAGLTEPLEELGFNLVGYGCTTCIGNSGPLPDEISAAVNEHDLAVVSVLSGNRNFEGRINPDVKMKLPGVPAARRRLRARRDDGVGPFNDPFPGSDVMLRDVWPDSARGRRGVEYAVQSDMFRKSYGEVFEGDERWNGLKIPGRTLRLGPTTRPTCAGPVLRRHGARAARRSPTSRAPACSPSWATA